MLLSTCLFVMATTTLLHCFTCCAAAKQQQQRAKHHAALLVERSSAPPVVLNGQRMHDYGIITEERGGTKSSRTAGQRAQQSE